jgi:hypothetical protein
MTKLTKQTRLDRGNHRALDRLAIKLSAERETELVHNDIVTEALGALAASRPDLAPIILAARQEAPAAVVA